MKERSSSAFVPATLCAALISLAVGRVAATYGTLSATYDEGAHLALGVEWLTQGKLEQDLLHPPLGRSLIALAPVADGVRSTGRPLMWTEGVALLYGSDTTRFDERRYWRTLTLARMGVLPWLVIASVCIAVWGFMLGGWPLAIVSTAIFTNLPLVLAHSGFATTDMAGLSGFLAVLVAATAWLRRQTIRRGALLGLAIGLAVTTKMTALPFAIVGGGSALVVGAVLHRGALREWRRLARESAPSVVVALAVAGVAIWAAYGFTVGRIRGIPVPAPALLRGLRELLDHNGDGQISFLLGEVGTQGWWYFFPVTLAVKTPLPVLLLFVVGAIAVLHALARSREWERSVPLIAGGVILAFVVSTTRMNLGVRHVLPVVTLFSFVAAQGVLTLWSSSRARAALRGGVTVALAWLLVGTARIHPDYLAYFNELAGDEPGRIVVDSDLDWGQDLHRLALAVRARNIDTVSVAYYGIGREQQMLGATVVRPFRRGDHPTGWVAISETPYRRGTATYIDRKWTTYPDSYDWLRAYTPEARIGRSIRLYRIPDMVE